MIEQKLCQSLSGLDLPLLTVTDYVENAKNTNKYLVIITGRVHPGESNSSLMVEGFLKFILGESEEAKQIRKQFVFKIVPMLNPDGVVLGNYRTGVAGKDLNRQYKQNSQEFFPTVAGIKDLARRCKEQFEDNVVAFVDFHGHSIKRNVFAYGPEFKQTDYRYYEAQFIPLMLENKCQMFKMNSCDFHIAQNKQSTARAIFFKSFGINNTYTLEASFGNYQNKEGKIIEFTKEGFLEMGKVFGETMLEFYNTILQFKLKNLHQKQLITIDQFQVPNQRALSSVINRNQEQSNNDSQKKNKNKKKKKKIKQIASRQSDQIYLFDQTQTIDSNQIEYQKEQESKQTYLQHFKGLINQLNCKNQEASKKVKIEEDQIGQDESDCESQSEDLNDTEFQQLQQKITSQCKKFQETMFFENNDIKFKPSSISPPNPKSAQKSISQKPQLNLDEKEQNNKAKTINLKNIKHKIEIGPLIQKPKIFITTPIKVDIPTNIKYDQNIKVPSHVIAMKKNYQYRKLYNMLPVLQVMEVAQQCTSKSILHQPVQVNLMDTCLIPSDSLMQNQDEEEKTVIKKNKPKVKCITQNNGCKLKKRKLKKIDRQLPNLPVQNSLNGNSLNENYLKKKGLETRKIKSIINSEAKQENQQQQEEKVNYLVDQQIFQQPMSAGGYQGYQTYQLSQISKFTTLYNNKKSYL